MTLHLLTDRFEIFLGRRDARTRASSVVAVPFPFPFLVEPAVEIVHRDVGLVDLDDWSDELRDNATQRSPGPDATSEVGPTIDRRRGCEVSCAHAVVPGASMPRGMA